MPRIELPYELSHSVFEVHSPNIVSDDVRNVVYCIVKVITILLYAR